MRLYTKFMVWSVLNLVMVGTITLGGTWLLLGANGLIVHYLFRGGINSIMDSINKKEPPLAGQFPETDVEKITVTGDGAAVVNDLFYRRGWTDGLPIVVPTRARVQAMLQVTRRDRSEEVATLPPMNGIATVEKIAVNAVMAGCRPEHMPILLAAVEAVADPDFDLRGLATTTSPDVPCLIITGPIAKQIGLNTGTGVMRPSRSERSWTVTRRLPSDSLPASSATLRSAWRRIAREESRTSAFERAVMATSRSPWAMSG